MMTSTAFPLRAMLLSLLSLMTMMRAAYLYSASPPVGQSNQPSSDAGTPAIDVRGTWSGTFYSNHSDVGPFTISVVITPNSLGHLIGSSTLASHCLHDASLEVTVTGSNIVLAGSDKEGDNITVRGSVDNTGSLLKATYILNGSATGACETDDGSGTLTKR